MTIQEWALYVVIPFLLGIWFLIAYYRMLTR